MDLFFKHFADIYISNLFLFQYAGVSSKLYLLPSFFCIDRVMKLLGRDKIPIEF